MTRRANQSKTNGHAGPQDHLNGHAPASTEWGGIPAPACSSNRQPGPAASDDASGISVASAAASQAAAGSQQRVSTGRNACAEAAPPHPNGTAHLPPGQDNLDEHNQDGHNQDKESVPPGAHPLPDNAAEFVEEIHRKIDITEVWHNLLRHGDEKVKQRAVERLTDLFYKVGAAMEEEPQHIVIDVPRPDRD